MQSCEIKPQEAKVFNEIKKFYLNVFLTVFWASFKTYYTNCILNCYRLRAAPKKLFILHIIS